MKTHSASMMKVGSCSFGSAFVRFGLFCVLVLCSGSHSFANNIQLSNFGIASQDTAARTALIKFDVSWENSWRTTTFESNYDGAWVFVKYRLGKTVMAQTAKLIGSISIPGCIVRVSSDGMGAFVYRDPTAIGVGPVNYQNIQLRWDYSALGIPVGTAVNNVEITVHAIEMVYVPQGPYDLGDGNTANGEIHPLNNNNPVYITSETQQFAVAIDDGGVGVQSHFASGAYGSTGSPGSSYTVSQTFPKGYAALWCMKYEISQGQWVGFLNSLDYLRQPGNAIPMDDTARQAIVVSFPGFADSIPRTYAVDLNKDGTYGDGEDQPVVRMTYSQLEAYLDWAGLRPMTELEYEKCCRGPLSAVPGEYAWGDAQIHNAHYTLANTGLASEAILNLPLTGNATVSETAPTPTGGASPLRVGAVPGSVVGGSRQTTGASYWGIMELTGNAPEFVVSINAAWINNYTGVHGNGDLTVFGQHNVSGWPSHQSTFGFRGGGYNMSSGVSSVSNRRNAMLNSTNTPGGGRGVRTDN